MSRYKFKGYTITNCGYHQPDHCVWWEAVDENGEACFHGNTLREVEFQILDYEWEQKMKKKDEEIEKLKREKIEVEADALAVGGIVEAARRREETAEKSSAVGNAAAMLGAMLAIRDINDRRPHDADGYEINDIINDALSAPARNCDIYKNKKDAEAAFISEECKHPCGNCTINDKYGCALVHECGVDWLFAPAAERKGEGDGR